MNLFCRTVCGAVITLAAAAIFAQDLPSYSPGPAVSGPLRIWGDSQMREVVGRWAKLLRKHHPDVRIETKLLGTDSAMAGLYTGLADIVLMGREPSYSEVQAFEWIFRYKPDRLELLSGSLEAPGKSPAVVVFVHRDNPLTKLTFAQLDAIYDYEHRRGLAAIHTWGDLGLSGDWASQPIRLYGPDFTSGTGRFFESVVLKGSKNIYWDRMREIPESQGSTGSVVDAAGPILEALAKDRFGIAIADLHFARPEVKSLALAGDSGEPFVEPTVESIIARTYPLSRPILAFVNRAPGKPMDARIKEFLRLVLSKQGQGEVRGAADFLPLTPKVVRDQLKEFN